MRWDTKRPTSAGLFWVSVPGSGPEVVRLRPDSAGGVTYMEVVFPESTGNSIALDDEALNEAKWAGPIEPPER
jgi:hypothetical protein